MLARLGNVINWIGIIWLVLWVALGIISETNEGIPFWGALGIGTVGYIVGRTLKYILGDLIFKGLFGKSYTDGALIKSVNCMRLIDSHLEEDFLEKPPEGIPDSDKYISVTFFGVFNKNKINAARKRVAFNMGLMSEVCNYFYDGEARDFDGFCIEAIKNGVYMGDTVIKDFKKVPLKEPECFSIGSNWATYFIKKRITGTSPKDEEELVVPLSALDSDTSWPDDKKLETLSLGEHSFSGVGVEFYENGGKEREANYKFGKRDGIYTEWFENGQKKLEGYYKNGMPDRTHTRWHENGQKREYIFFDELEFIDDLERGEIIALDGQPFSGVGVNFYENKKRKRESNYKFGKRDGLYNEWFENGQKKEEGCFKLGQKFGLTTQYYESGKKREEKYHVSNSDHTILDVEREVVHTIWDENGKKESDYDFAFRDSANWEDENFVKWYKNKVDLEANQGDVDAQLKLGALYKNGFGVSKDHVLAHMWYSLSSSKENTEEPHFGSARDQKERIAMKMTPQQIEKAQEMARNWKPKK